MLRRQGWRHPGFWIALLILGILSLPLLGRAADTGPLPAAGWNPKNLSRIQAPAAGPLIFAVLGDNRKNTRVLGEMLKEIDGDPSLGFAIHLGDMVWEGDPVNYGLFFRVVRRNLHKPMLTVIGNHELQKNGLPLYRRIFGQDYYSFRINDHYFIIINDAADTVDPGQLRWLAAELRKSQTCKTRLVFLHIPLYDPRGGAYHHCLPPEAASRLGGLFKKYKVSHVFAAHIHSYYAGNWEGVPFTVSGGAGASNFPWPDYFHYLKVPVRGDEVRVQVRPLPPQAGAEEPLSWLTDRIYGAVTVR